jgi:hypothetical protein
LLCLQSQSERDRRFSERRTLNFFRLMPNDYENRLRIQA